MFNRLMCLLFGHESICTKFLNGNPFISITNDERGTIFKINPCRRCGTMFSVKEKISTLDVDGDDIVGTVEEEPKE
jgi:hypothetical protein